MIAIPSIPAPTVDLDPSALQVAAPPPKAPSTNLRDQAMQDAGNEMGNLGLGLWKKQAARMPGAWDMAKMGGFGTLKGATQSPSGVFRDMMKDEAFRRAIIQSILGGYPSTPPAEQLPDPETEPAK